MSITILNVPYDLFIPEMTKLILKHKTIWKGSCEFIWRFYSPYEITKLVSTTSTLQWKGTSLLLSYHKLFRPYDR